MSDKNLDNFFSGTKSAFTSAAARHGLLEYDFVVAGHSFRLRFAGPALLPRLLPALGHLVASGKLKPDLVINIWDSASTGEPLPPVPWGKEGAASRSEVVSCQGGSRTVFLDSKESLQLWDGAAKKAFFWTRSAEALPYHVSSNPFIYIFHAWASVHGLQVVHAGAVGTAAGAVLVAGRGGAGKSTSCLACLGSGLRYLADDYCLICAGPRPTVYSLYSSGKKRSDDLKRLPELARFIANSENVSEEKAVYFFYPELKNELLAESHIKAIVTPVLRGEKEATLEEIPKMEAVLAMAASTVFQLPSAGQKALASIAGMAGGLPCYRLNVGNNVATVPAAIKELLKKL
jgi:hypothetical protein